MAEPSILQYARVYLTSGSFLDDAGTVREIRGGKALVRWDDTEEPTEIELSRLTLLRNCGYDPDVPAGGRPVAARHGAGRRGKP